MNIKSLTLLIAFFISNMVNATENDNIKLNKGSVVDEYKVMGNILRLDPGIATTLIALNSESALSCNSVLNYELFTTLESVNELLAFERAAGVGYDKKVRSKLFQKALRDVCHIASSKKS